MADREKVIKGLEDSFANQGCGYMDGVGELYAVSGEDLQNAIALLKEENWVKCSDRMPEERDTIFAKLKGTDKWKSTMFEKMSEDVRVVVVFEDGTRRVHHSYTVDGQWDVEKKLPKRTVTHWMPNPELPEEGR